MRLPWVSRETMRSWQEQALAAEGRAALLHDDLSVERERYERLVTTVTEMQRAGFVAREPVRFEPDSEAVMGAGVLAAIATRAHGPELRRQLMQYAVEQRANGVSDEAVESAIWEGSA